MSGTFDPAASPITGGYALVNEAVGFITAQQAQRIDALVAKADGEDRIEAYGTKDGKTWRKTFKSQADLEKWLEQTGAKLQGTRRADAARSDAGQSLKQLREELHEMQMDLEKAIRNKDAEMIRECREEIARIRLEIEKLPD